MTEQMIWTGMGIAGGIALEQQFHVPLDYAAVLLAVSFLSLMVNQWHELVEGEAQ